MQVQPLPTDVRIEPGFPVEQLYNVDGKTLRVDIEWKMVEVFLGGAAPTAEAVRGALQTHHGAIDRVVKAKLFAQGFPLSNDLMLTPSDFGADQQQ
jgi:hypothetical protein